MKLSSSTVQWDIRSKGRSWDGEEAFPRYEMRPSKIEMVDGKLLSTDEERETLLGLLLENIGAERVVQFGNPQVWRDAASMLKD